MNAIVFGARQKTYPTIQTNQRFTKLAQRELGSIIYLPMFVYALTGFNRQ